MSVMSPRIYIPWALLFVCGAVVGYAAATMWPISTSFEQCVLNHARGQPTQDVAVLYCLKQFPQGFERPKPK